MVLRSRQLVAAAEPDGAAGHHGVADGAGDAGEGDEFIGGIGKSAA